MANENNKRQIRYRRQRRPWRFFTKWLRNNVLSVALSIFAIALSAFFAIDARQSGKRVETLVIAGLYQINEEFAKRMGLDISKIEDPLLFAEIRIAANRGKSDLMESLEKYLKLAPESGYPYFLIGYYFSDNDNSIPEIPDSAVYYYSKAIDYFTENDPNLYVAFNNRGVEMIKLGSFVAAVADFDEAIRLNPEFAESFLNRGEAKDDLGRFDDAIIDFDEAIRLRPDFARAFNGRGNAKSDLERFEEAIEDYTKSIELKNPEIWFPLNNRGVAKKSLGRYRDAIADFDSTIWLFGEDNPAIADVLVSRGNVKALLERWAEAMNDYDKALRLRPDFAEVFDRKGFVFFKRGNIGAAVKANYQALDMDPKLADAQKNAGIYALYENRFDDSFSDFSKAIELDPENKKRIAEDEDILAWLTNPKNAAHAPDVRNKIGSIISPEKLE